MYYLIFLQQPLLSLRPYSAMARGYDGLGMDHSRSYLGGRSLSGPEGMASLRNNRSHYDYDVGGHRYLASRRFVISPLQTPFP